MFYLNANEKIWYQNDRYLFPEGPDGILKVFCRLNLPGGTPSPDWDKLMLRCLKNSKPPLELGSYKKNTY